jgi:hypothetical protein
MASALTNCVMHGGRATHIAEIASTVMVAALAVVVATGCCLFAGHHTAGQEVSALCLATLTCLMIVMSAALLPPVGWVVRPRTLIRCSVAHNAPDPPPKSAPFV